ncbi:MAG: hypothetical protein ACAH95_07095 [Fimbriimonas sp.]
MATISLAGKYVGRSKVREGREDELSPPERKQLQRGAAEIDLELRENGTFTKQVTEGTWREVGDRVLFTPKKFGGKTLEEMTRAAEEMDRAFGLSFVFHEFDLLIRGETLLSSDERTLIYTEFTRKP